MVTSDAALRHGILEALAFPNMEHAAHNDEGHGCLREDVTSLSGVTYLFHLVTDRQVTNPSSYPRDLKSICIDTMELRKNEFLSG